MRADSADPSAAAGFAAQLIAHARDGVLATDAAGCVVECNPAAERLLGWPRSEALGRPLSALLVPVHADELHASGLQTYLRSGATRGLDGLLELDVLRRDGQPVTLELSVFSLPGGGMAGLFLRDVSERQSTQRALRQSEERYRALVEHLVQGMAVIQHGRVAFWNARALAIMRLQAGDVDGADYLQWLHPEDRGLAAVRQQARQRGDKAAHRYELRRLLPGGDLRWLDVHATVVPWGGEPATMVFFSDITEAKATRAALHASEERFRAVIERLTEGMVVVQDEKVVYANPRAAEIAAMPLAQMLQVGFLTRVHPDDQALVLERQRTRLAGGHPPDRYELRLLLPGDVVRWIAIGVAVVPWGGAPAALIFFSDVTAHKAMTEEIRVSEQRMRAVVEHAGEGTMVVIEADKPAFVNQRALEIMRMTREELDRRGYLQLLHPDDRAMVVDRRQRRLAGEPVESRYEVRLLGGDGAQRWIEMGTTIVPWSGQRATLTFFSDITERKLMLEALHRSEERYRAVVEHVGEGMVVVQDGRFVFVNERALQIARRPRGAMLGQTFVDPVHPDDRPLVAERQRQRVAGQRVPDRYELRLLHADGSTTWIEIGVTQVPWEGKSASLGFFSDVSRRKALEARLRDTLAERETILENSLVGIAFLTQDQVLRWANRAMGRIFRTDRALRSVPNWSEVAFDTLFPTPEDHARASAEIAARMAAQLPYEAELQLRRRDGALFWASVTGTAVSSSDITRGTVWTVMDVTERKELEVALKRTSSEREAIFASVLVGIAFNVNRRIRWVNDKFVEIMGYSREELTGQPSRMLYPDEESYLREGLLTAEHLRRDGHYTSERQMVRKNGERIWVQLAGRCVFGKNPEAGAIWTFLDITDRKRAEDDIRAALARQQELNVLRSRFVAMTSHEFRTPLATIMSSAELIAHYGERMAGEERQEVLEGIVNGVQRMTGMLDRMLLIGRADAQMLDCRPQPLDLAALCRHCAEEARSQYPERAADIVVEYRSASPEGQFDERLLRHVLGNLLSNAVKYSPNGGQVCLQVRDEDARRVFEVSDHGIGIPQAEQAHLFETFHRASNVGAIPGTGLGLAIAKKAVEAHGGSIEVLSTAGRGSCFRVLL
ncbi:PAS domain S-box protein [Pseudorhodoferax sp. Leaf274]|uniref:PAS domain S-box protein n=1 Tax=Pseudorhodoferax sp. Leaf274 TaxID=1736318 RepID=UPI000A5BD6B7|nr:PAS domain S-box protein [Pseudorhodoferax sp. Leaf274]